MPLDRLIAGRFEIQRAAGAGGMATVYRALDRESGETVAVKIMRRNLGEMARFEREAKVLAALQHPGIVRYLAHGITDDGEPFLAMEWLDGEDLDALLARGALSVIDAVRIAKQVAAALGAAHAKGVIHRDLKPGNIFLARGRMEPVRLMDFGIARVDGDDARIRTDTGVVIGTPGYMAPEQARGEREIDARADVFALGCVLYECLAGQAAFLGEQPIALLAKVLFEEPKPLLELRPDTPPAIADLVARSLEKDPTRRPADAREFAAALTGAGADTPPERARPRAAQRLTQDEQRVLSVVLARPRSTPSRDDFERAPTVSAENPLARLDRLRAMATRAGAVLERMVDGSYIAILSGLGDASDCAAVAARFALALASTLDDVAVVLTTGRGVLRAEGAVGEVIDRAAAMLAHDLVSLAVEAGDGGYPIRVDSLTAGLLATRFFIRSDDAGQWLFAERDALDGVRTLLGHRTPFVGRSRELNAVMEMLDPYRNGPAARAVVISGPPGIGKSRLRHEALRALAGHGVPFDLWFARADIASRVEPFALIAEAIRRTAGIWSEDLRSVQRDQLLACVHRTVPPGESQRIATFLGVMLGVADEADDLVQLRAARRDPRMMHDQLQRAWEDWVRAETAARPILFVIEDLHAADPASLAMIDSALRIAKDCRFILIATTREAPGSQSTRAWPADAVRELVIAPLDLSSSLALVRSALGDKAPPADAQRLADAGMGNPFMLEELIRAYAAGEREGAPDTVLAMAQSRLESLDPTLRRVLRAASILGSRFRANEVAALIGMTNAEVVVDAQLGRLRDREWLVRVDRAATRDAVYAFPHALLHEAAYASLTTDDRALGHLLAAEWLAARDETAATRIADHFERGGAPDRAVIWRVRAAVHALDAGELRSALDHASTAVRAGAMGETLGTAHKVMAAVQRLRGEANDAARHADAALTLLPCGPAWHEAMAHAVMLHGQLEHQGRVRQLIQELLATRPPGDLDARRAAALALAMAPAMHMGDRETAHALRDQLEREAAPLDDRDAQVAAWVARARMVECRHAGDVASALRWSLVALEKFDTIGDRMRACHARGDLAYAYMELGAYAEAERTLREVFEIDERMASGPVGAMSLHNLGWTIARQGRHEEAREVEQQAIDRFHAAGDRRMEGLSRIYMAAIMMARNEATAAETEARMALALLDGSPALLPIALGVFAEVLLATGRASQALAAAAKAVADIEAQGGIEEGEARVRLVHIDALMASGRHDDARAAIHRAHERVLARADQLVDASWRDRYLRNVPENARITALASTR